MIYIYIYINVTEIYNYMYRHYVVQLLSHVQLFVTPWTSAHQASLSFLFPGVGSNSCPSGRWCHPTISSSPALFSFCLQSFPASGSFLMSWLFASGGQSIKSFSIRAFKEYSGADFPLDWLVWSCCPRDSQESFLAPRFESINFLVLSLLSGPTPTSINDYFLFIM